MSFSKDIDSNKVSGTAFCSGVLVAISNPAFALASKSNLLPIK
jgi:hypothetical protein